MFLLRFFLLKGYSKLMSPSLCYFQGQAICSYYSMYGLCKYGPTCRFDHPPMAYNYSVSLPAMLEPSFLPRSFPTAHASETSQSISSKFLDVVQKPLSNKHQNPDTRISEDSAEQGGSMPQSPSSSEPLDDQSG